MRLLVLIVLALIIGGLAITTPPAVVRESDTQAPVPCVCDK